MGGFLMLICFSLSGVYLQSSLGVVSESYRQIYRMEGRERIWYEFGSEARHSEHQLSVYNGEDR